MTNGMDGTNGVDLAAAAVDAIARAGTAAAAYADGTVGAGGAGGTVGGTAVEMVRGRLGGVAEGPEDIAAVERAPEDILARSRLRESVAAVLAEDPAFAARLGELLAPPPPPLPPGPPPGFDGGPADRGGRTGGVGAVGRQALTRVRKREPVALLGLATVVAVLALAVYGIAGLVAGDGHQVTALKSGDAVKSVVPDLHAMPVGWTNVSDPTVKSCDASADRCKGVLYLALSSFTDTSGQSASFGVAACATADDAQRVYREMTKEETSGEPLSLPSLGQQSTAFEISKGEAHAYARVGTVVVYVSEQGSHDDYQVATLKSLARMAVARAQQAQDGETPGAQAG